MTQIKLEDAETYLMEEARLLNGTLDASHLQNWLTYKIRELRKRKEAEARAE